MSGRLSTHRGAELTYFVVHRPSRRADAAGRSVGLQSSNRRICCEMSDAGACSSASCVSCRFSAAGDVSVAQTAAARLAVEAVRGKTPGLGAKTTAAMWGT